MSKLFQSIFSRRLTKRHLLILAGTLFVIGAALWMPTSESFWIDEAITFQFASLPSFGDLLHKLATDRDSLTQMPLGIMAKWAWVHLGFQSEWSLRFLNSLWVLLGAYGMFLTGRCLKLPLLPLWFCLQPFLWFYANEFRPYTLQIAGSAWVLHGMVACLLQRGMGSAWAWSLAVGGLIMAGATLIGFFPLGIVLLILIYFFRAWRTMPDRWAWLPLGIGLVLLALLGAHDAATLARGAGGVRFWRVSVLNPLFAGYELLGFSGLGPGRLGIREAAREGLPSFIGLFKSSFIGLSILGFLYLMLLLPLKKGINDINKTVWVPIAFLTASTPLLLFVAGLIAGWPFWGRHLSPVLPLITCIIAFLADRFFRQNSNQLKGILIPALFSLTLLVSSLSLRFLPQHRKDDYRKAASIAKRAAEQGNIVWWSADLDTANYYNVSFNRTTENGGIIYLASHFQNGKGMIADPTLVLTSKPDLFDIDGQLALWLKVRHYRAAETFPAFTLWQRP